MSLFIKVCGLTDPAAVEACSRSGVDAVGFVFAESPRQVSTAIAVRLSTLLPDHILRVAVFRRPDPTDIERVLHEFGPDLVQADHDTLPPMTGTGTLPVYREGRSKLPEGGRYLFEGPTSGVGRRVGLTGAARLATTGEMVLAGGLTPHNVSRAVRVVRPFGVDVSSGVESAPGEKDPGLIHSFVVSARRAAERLVDV